MPLFSGGLWSVCGLRRLWSDHQTTACGGRSRGRGIQCCRCPRTSVSRIRAAAARSTGWCRSGGADRVLLMDQRHRVVSLAPGPPQAIRATWCWLMTGRMPPSVIATKRLHGRPVSTSRTYRIFTMRRPDLARLRRLAGLTQEALAERLGRGAAECCPLGTRRVQAAADATTGLLGERAAEISTVPAVIRGLAASSGRS